MKLSDLAREAVASDPKITGITADSRLVDRGFLFAALPGVHADGAKFIPQAEEQGAAAVLASPGVISKLPMIIDNKPRRRLAQMAARFYPKQPEMIAAITGTNGKTSTALFAAQIWSRVGKASGSLGTLGAESKAYMRKLNHTTPEPVTLHRTLDEMARAGVTHLAMEASSHALAQHRSDGVKMKIAAFTNITQDHLDYHDSFEEYFAAKARLFDELLLEGGIVVINADGEGAEDFKALARRRGLKTITTGALGDDVKLLSIDVRPSGLRLAVETDGARYEIETGLIGAFQAENALLAAGIAIASGAAPSSAVQALEYVSGAPGRMQRVANDNRLGVFVDYAHTPDAVATALRAVRPHANGRVIAIIGAGGDRDNTKRSLMGAAAAQNADVVIVTDDNPRSEDPGAIRKQVMKGCPDAEDIGDREEAIATGVAMLRDGDVLLIMGKGHEAGQVVGDQTLPFDDVEVASKVVADRYRELKS